jgi:hypothetical protein
MANLPNHLRGDTWVGFSLTATDTTDTENPVPYSFTGARAIFQLRVGAGRNHPLVFELTTDADGGLTTSGVSDVNLDAAARVLDLPAAVYYAEIQVTFSDGVVLTLYQGTLTITEDVADD